MNADVMSAEVMSADAAIAVFVESGKRRVFASALDWPGWARSGKTEDQAVATLADYRARYALVAALAHVSAPIGPLVISERHVGLAKNADFGALGEIAPSDSRPLSAADGSRLAALLMAAWEAFDEVAAEAPAELRKGPRGGGRDTAQIVDHVLGAEAMYARKMGLPRPPKGDSHGDAAAVLQPAIIAALQAPSSPATPAVGWLPRMAVRRMAWHVLDHLWEIEDKSEPA